MKLHSFEHRFVEYLPERLQEGRVYVSIPYATAAHQCACGCGNTVITPLSPTDWKLTFDGRTISLFPSIGNWSFPCQSHYWITHDQVTWAPPWSQEEINLGREQDRVAKDKHYSSREQPTYDATTPLWQRITRWLASRRRGKR